MQELFVFFTGTPLQYEILNRKLSTQGKKSYVLKNLNDTRWSCHADATKALVCGYNNIEEALAEIADDKEEKDAVRCQARGLLQKMALLETGIYTVFWHDILDTFNRTNEKLQNSTMTLNTAVNLLKSLSGFVESKRDEFEKYEEGGKELSGADEYEIVRSRPRSKRQQPLDYGRTAAVELSPREKFRTEAFLQVLDQLTVSLTERLEAYKAQYSL